MDYVLEYNDLKNLPDRGLTITQCGYQRCKSGHSCMSVLSSDYSVTFVIGGKGVYSVGGAEHEICAGQGFVIRPSEKVGYRADVDDPWNYIYVIIKGFDAQILLKNAGICGERVTFDFELDAEMRDLLFRMQEAGKSYGAKGYDVLGYFYLIMSRLVVAEGERRRYSDDPEEYIRKAVEYISEHYQYHITLENIAGFVNIDRTYLHRLFVKHFGASPMRYLTSFRLKKAVELMERPNVTLSEAAMLSGFYDFSHFSRVFCAEYGMPPGKYRADKYKKS